MNRTISVMVGKGSVSHNSRRFHARNTDPERAHLNRSYCNESIRAVYHELFDEALVRYNARQTRADRRIENYYEKIRQSRQERPFHEIILQIGNREDMNAQSENGELAARVLDAYMQEFQGRNPNLRVFSAHLHMDEATPHLHIDFVPFTTGSKRGLDTRVSLKKALAAQGFPGGSREDTEWNQWVQAEKEELAMVMERHGIAWEQKGTHEKHLDVLDFKKAQRAKEIAELETVRNKTKAEADQQQKRLRELAPAVENMEGLARQFSDDPEQLLPPAGAMESAKAYREKKVKPLMAEIVRVLRAVCAAFLPMHNRLKQLERDYDRERSRSNNLSLRLHAAMSENKALQKIAEDFERVKQAIAPQEIHRILEASRRRTMEERRGKRREERDIPLSGR